MKEMDEIGHEAAEAARNEDVHPRRRGGRDVLMTDVARAWPVPLIRPSPGSSTFPDVVKPETRRRVDEAIRQLDYRPNSVARALASGQSRTIGVVSFDTRLYGPASTLHAIERAAHGAGYSVSIVSLDSLERGAILDAVRRLRHQAVDGVIIIAALAAASALRELPPRPPGNLGGRIDGRADSGGRRRSARRSIEGDQPFARPGPLHGLAPRRAARLVRGKSTNRRLAIGAGRGRSDSAPAIAGRLEPACSGYEQGQRLVARRVDVTAVFVANDQMALGVLRAFREAGDRCSRRHQHRRVRRHPRGTVLRPSLDHRPPGVQPGRHAEHGPSARSDKGPRLGSRSRS